MPQLTQKNKTVAVESSLGEDVLILISMSGTEELGRPFQYELQLVSEQPDKVDFNAIVGENMTVRMTLADGETRYFNGFVSQFSQVRWDGSVTHYRATLVPWLWFMTRTADYHIFQEMTVPDIIKQVFRDRGFSEFEESLTGTYRTWEYCVQYRETDFNFVSRLMEQEGIYYFFKHENGKHTLVLADSPSAHEPITGVSPVPYYPPAKQRRDEECLTDWVVRQKIQPTAFELNAFDFKAPAKALVVKTMIEREHAAADGEIYDYPGPYTESGDGEIYSRIRIEELQAQFEISYGESDARGIITGGTLTAGKLPVEDQNKDYLITAVSYKITSDQNLAAENQRGSSDTDSNADSDADQLFFCRFQAIAAANPYRALRSTPKPTIQGPQTAFVVGPDGDEIHTDEHGRVKVQFHWDRYGKADENSSCWIRVAQTSAGKKWGGMTLPRIGQEVMVEFLEGDPDRPIVTGRVYNGSAKPPYDLPANKTISTVKSNSSKGGAGFNEIRFEDKKDEEQVFVHAQKNLDIRILNDRFETTLNNRHLVVEVDKFEHVKNNRNEKVDNDHLEEIGNDRNLKVAGKEALETTGSRSLKVVDDVIEEFGANHSEVVTGDLYLKADNICIEALTNVTIKVGDSFIAIESGGIKIGTGGDVVVDGGGAVDVIAGGNFTIEGGGSGTISASAVDIN